MSTLKVNSIVEATSGAGDFAQTRAWLNFDHVTPSIRDSFKVSSVADIATGRIDVNLTNAMSDINYCSSGSAGHATSGATRIVSTNNALGNTSSKVDCLIENAGGTQVDTGYVGVYVIGDLA